MPKSSDSLSIASESEITESLPGDFYEGSLVKKLIKKDEDIQSISEPIFKNIDGFIEELSSLKSHIIGLEEQLISKNQEIESLKAALAQSQCRNIELNEKIDSITPSIADDNILEEISRLDLEESRMSSNSSIWPPHRPTNIQDFKKFLNRRSRRQIRQNPIVGDVFRTENGLMPPETRRFKEEYDEDLILGP